jgi:predicted ATP-grasp superfamily ATP-dependent carboligase
VSSSRDRPFVLVAALSGRVLAAAAARAGFVPLVADLFGDLDTRAIARDLIRLPGSLAQGLRRKSLLDALDRLADGRTTEGIVYGSGFEDRPGLLAAIGRRYRLLGTPPETVARVKDPFAFSALCHRAGIPHPTTRRTGQARGRWLEKRIGAAGGAHVRPAETRRADRPMWYYQRRVGGQSVSALFLADGQHALVLGFSEQWSDPIPGQPFRYGGAVRPASVPEAQSQQMASAVARLAADSGVVGLCSADFLLRPDGFDLLEVNPRPGATLDIFHGTEGRLFHLHLDACGGRLPDRSPSFAGAAAAAVVYARAAIRLPAGFMWPSWTADRQPSGEDVPAGAPLCTVIAEAETACLARRVVDERKNEILAMTGASR